MKLSRIIIGMSCLGFLIAVNAQDDFHYRYYRRIHVINNCDVTLKFTNKVNEKVLPGWPDKLKPHGKFSQKIYKIQDGKLEGYINVESSDKKKFPRNSFIGFDFRG